MPANIGDPKNVSALVQEINEAHTQNNPSDLVKAARQLIRSFEDPEDEVWRFVLGGWASFGAMVSVLRMGLLSVWEGKKTSKELAAQCQADSKLIGQ